MTNRELYLEIAGFQQRFRDVERSLEAYLLGLQKLAEAHRHRPELPPHDFCRLLSEAFTAQPAPFLEAWRERPDAPEDGGHPGWEATLIEQVVDLREMAENGQLANPHRYFGITSPRGHDWYNFDPLTFLECAMAGTFKGWEPGDAGSRSLVPGPVLTMNEAGELVESPANEIPRPVFTIPAVSWNDFRDFLRSGQWYE